ncbi:MULTISPECIES: carbohydrate kinase [unclassified Kitasatospora]|uniref:carbohydrate kinase family protein n=1 Tax=unclassified Kitasatospora TaxID=2633591 RepID=UPI00070DF4FF|nr:MULTISPECIES: carbohydrate kinase [unclassified Kitasatospora]KQV19315.1 fructokinase [Kitasatospora sp. Root107]KRB77590.1 fructokinase [Kitasatospora sp. Root187]
MAQRPIAVLGECVADAFADTVQPRPGELALRVLPGGGPANTAAALARLGTPTRFVGRISSDAFGALFRAHLASSGVDLAGVVAASEPSTMAIATVDEHGQAQYSFHAEGTADWQWTAAELAAAHPKDAACLHTGSLALVRAPSDERIEELLTRARSSATVSIDPNVRPLLIDPAVYRARLARWCALADILRLSSDDLELLMPGVTPERACDAWHLAGVRLVVITLGGRGAIASLDGARVFAPAPQVQVVDTIGAGDSFTAGLLHRLSRAGRLGGRLHDLSADEVSDACDYAARVAALTCSVAGPNPPWAHQMESTPAASR